LGRAFYGQALIVYPITELSQEKIAPFLRQLSPLPLGSRERWGLLEAQSRGGGVGEFMGWGERLFFAAAVFEDVEGP